jgi:hypothetical protein
LGVNQAAPDTAIRHPRGKCGEEGLKRGVEGGLKQEMSGADAD